MCSYRIRSEPNPGSRVLIKEKKLWAQIHRGGQCGDTRGELPVIRRADVRVKCLQGKEVRAALTARSWKGGRILSSPRVFRKE